MKKPLLLALCLLALPFCSGSASLTGSVSQIFPLAFNTSAIYVNSQSFELDYYLVNEGSEDLVVELLVDLTGIDFQPGVSIDLAGDVAPGQPRAEVLHQLSQQPVFDLPVISSGNLTLSGGGQPGQYTTGSFQMAFSDTPSALGGGYTLSGSFAATAQSGGFPILDGGGSGCETECGTVCCPRGETCLDGGCCAAPCGTACCGANQVCYTNAATNAQTCVPTCASSVSCQALGLECCSPMPGGVSGCLPNADVTAESVCTCVLPSECSFGDFTGVNAGCCAPSTNAAGNPVPPLICQNNDGAPYDCCNGGQTCEGLACCAASPNGSSICVTQCTDDGGECGTAACLGAGSGWDPSGTTCVPTESICGP